MERGDPAPADPASDITLLLRAWGDGESGAFDRLVPLVYGELRRLAHGQLKGERPGHSVQTTALVNEAYLRLVDATRVSFHNRTQFFALAARVMRHVLVDAARARLAAKRGGGAPHVPLDASGHAAEGPDPELVALDDALEVLAKFDERKSKVVELRYFAGLSVKEVADVLAVSTDTVMRDWKLAKLWLLRELDRSASGVTERHCDGT